MRTQNTAKEQRGKIEAKHAGRQAGDATGSCQYTIDIAKLLSGILAAFQMKAQRNLLPLPRGCCPPTQFTELSHDMRCSPL